MFSAQPIIKGFQYNFVDYLFYGLSREIIRSKVEETHLDYPGVKLLFATAFAGFFLEEGVSDFYIVATPIGNYKDITFRAQEILQKVDFIACESEKEYDRLFGALRIPKKKFVVCSRDNEREAMEISYDLLKKGESGALISDCGTPLFEDPGFELLSFLRKKNIKIITIPGVNSIITALTLVPFKVKDFYFAGFISQKREIREKEIDLLLKRRETIILMESPYRLKNILELLRNRLKNRAVFVSYNLTQTDETLFYGDIAKVEKEISMKNINKGEYLIIIEALR